MRREPTSALWGFVLAGSGTVFVPAVEYSS